MVRSVSWDDWRIMDAIAETGTTSGAAELLGLNQSTVFRRITQLEEELGVRLFDRDRRGFRLSVQGEAILPDLKKLRDTATDIERRVSGLDERPAGDVRLSVNISIIRYLLGAHLPAFRKEHPEITVHLDLTDRLANIKEREADLAIRGHNDPDPDLFGRRLMRLSYAIYTSAANADLGTQSRAFMSDPVSLNWILWTGDLLKTAPGQWMRRNLGDVAPVLTATEVETTAYLAESGLGCCLLPRFLGDRHPGLAPISDTIPGLHTEIWVLTHEDLRRTARVSSLMRFIGATLRQSAELPTANSVASP